MNIVDLIVKLSIRINEVEHEKVQIKHERVTLQNKLEAAMDENGMLRNELSKLQHGEKENRIFLLENEVKHLRQRCKWLEDRRKDFQKVLKEKR